MIVWGITLAFIALLGLIWLMMRAPEGYEDDDGFHFGKKPDNKK